MNKSQQTYTKEQLNKIHEIEIEILTEVQRICKIGNISYFSLGGTTLGAVRHKGFIPWDDDIDIGMLREDYEKFLKLAQEQLNNKYTLQHFTVDSNTPSYFAKVRKNGTTFVERSVKKINMHHGIFVDIFPFDKIPEDIQDRKKYFKRVSFYRQLFIAKSVTSACMERKLSKRIVCGFLRKILHLILIPIKKEYIYKKLDESLRCCNQTQSHTLSTYGLKHFNPLLEWLIPVKTSPFENTEICVPNDCHSVLKEQFGDYMTLPPIENRVGHCPCILDFEKSFR